MLKPSFKAPPGHRKSRLISHGETEQDLMEKAALSRFYIGCGGEELQEAICGPGEWIRIFWGQHHERLRSKLV